MENDTNFYRYTSDGHPSRSYRALNVTRAAITRENKYCSTGRVYKVQKLEAIPVGGEPYQDGEGREWIVPYGAVLKWVDIDG